MENSSFWFGYLLSQNSQTSPVKLDIDINVWRFPKNKNLHMIDVGAKIYCPANIKCVYIFLPFQMKKENIYDLYQPLSNCKIANYIFNKKEIKCENISQTSEHSSYIKITSTGYNATSDTFCVLPIADNYELELIQQNNSSLIKIDGINNQKFKRQDTDQDFPVYFRFRLKEDSGVFGPVISSRKQNTSLTDSAFSMVERIEIKMNQWRNIDDATMTYIRGNKLQEFQFGSVNTFIISPFDDESTDSDDFKYKRTLENNEVWKKYLNTNEQRCPYDISNHIIYKADSSCLSPKGYYNSIASFRFRKNNGLTISLYVVIIGLLAISFNLVSQYIIALITSGNASCVYFAAAVLCLIIAALLIKFTK